MENHVSLNPPEEITPTPESKPTGFPCQLGLPPADETLLSDAKFAIRQEFRDSSKWKRLRCRKVAAFAERGRGTIYVIQLGSSVEFDWTWEGAIAFRPLSLDEKGDLIGAIPDFDFENAANKEELVWSGEIVEVDERNGCLFVSLADPERLPTVGSFFVRPFEFLAVLDAVYHDSRFDSIRAELPSRLAASAGGIHPPVAQSSVHGLTELNQLWQHSWSILWGPPGTGKTHKTGQQIAAILADKSERVLVVSTTNRATDAVAISIGKAARKDSPQELEAGHALRIGKGATYQTFADAGLASMLQGTESDILMQIDELARQLKLFETWDDKALTRKHIGELRNSSKDQSKHIFINSDVRVVVATAYKAMTLLDGENIRKLLDNRQAPFTTIFIDEAGLISRAAVAVLSLLASRRVVLIGDSKQLAPISRISRILPSKQEKWIASSGLSHLDDIEATSAGIHVLSEQYRMHPDVCNVVSAFQYAGLLKTASSIIDRASNLPASLANYSRAIWYVLDNEDADLTSIRAERGPGNRSWIRAITQKVLEKLFDDEDLRKSHGLFVSPYRAQAQWVAKHFAAWGIRTWEASTVHSQQGWEADIVIFDTVNAGSCNWPPDEWTRLVNVALSRAKEAVIVLASRNEMNEPYLRPLLGSLTPSILVNTDDGLQWQQVDLKAKTTFQKAESASAGNTLGEQIAARKEMQPVLSQEQQRLSNLELDGKPRLVRGVAGSGKSLVLSNWLAKTVNKFQEDKEAKVWAVYANRSLHKLLRDSIESAWSSFDNTKPFPWKRVSLLHVKDVLSGLLSSPSISLDPYDYDMAAEEVLNNQTGSTLLPRCNALFIDEAQDMGPNTLRLLLSLVEQSDAADNNSRSAHIFYDNAQNIYGRGTPRWSEFGLDMRGRSTIMKESFRSTRPITELAVNVLHRLAPPETSPDHSELLSLGLIEKTDRQGKEWLKVRFNQVHGPKPLFRKYKSEKEELLAIAEQLTRLITDERVSPEDICIIYNGNSVVTLLESELAPKMKQIGVELSVQVNRPYERMPNTLLVTTAHSYKGYDSEVVVIPFVDRFVAKDNQILAVPLYVAMTRARSLLAMFSSGGDYPASTQINDAIESCLSVLDAQPDIEDETSDQDDFNDILERIGPQHRKWLSSIWKDFEVIQEPITDAAGEIIAEPLLWFNREGKRFAFFGNEPPSLLVLQRLEEIAFRIIQSGEVLDA
ncbi:MAG: AAA family ATPase [Planctomycetes bacterium]|nr:AAA family ATPase [Planctomycetota bacterium]